MKDKRAVLRELGWSDDLLDAFSGEFPDTPADIVVAEPPSPQLLSTSEIFAVTADSNTTALVTKTS